MPLAPQLSLIGVSADDEEHFSSSGADPVQGGLLISTIALMWKKYETHNVFLCGSGNLCEANLCGD